MVIMALTAALMCAVQTSVLRGTAIAFALKGPFYRVEKLAFLFATIFMAGLHLSMLNRAMEIYPAIELMPIYNTFQILFNMVCGALILNEKAQYTLI